MVPRFNVPQFALGTNNNVGPIMSEKFPLGYSDTSLVITQVINFVFQMQDALNTTQIIGDPNYGYRKYSGNPNENINFQDNVTAKRGVYTDAYTKLYNYTSSNATQFQEMFYGRPTAYATKYWFQQAPYYNTYYSHIYYASNDTDLVLQTDKTSSNIIQDYINPLLTIPEDLSLIHI